MFINRPDLSDRFGKQYLNSIPIVNFETGYWGAWRGGIQQGLLTPIKGNSPSGTRNTCKILPSSLPNWLYLAKITVQITLRTFMFNYLRK